MNRKYLLKRQGEDKRDLKFTLERIVSLPSKVDFRVACPPVFDQGDLGSCTANAGVATYMMLKKTNVELSRLFLYFKERMIEGTTEEDAGATMRTIGKALNTYGVCTETIWPYVKFNFNVNPPCIADEDAATHKIVSYKKLSSITQVKQYLAQNNLPVMIGIDVYTSFESDAVAKTGVVPMPDTINEELLGGHAIAIVGYDDNFGKTQRSGGILSKLFDKLTGADEEDDGYFIVRNSWGADWGDEGYFYLPYEFVRKHAYDIWVLE